MRPHLLTLSPSHYCERARWALDRANIAYEEKRLAPGAHVLHLRRLNAPGTSLPVLLFTDGTLIQDSGRILDWTNLGGGDPDVERRLEEVVAPLIRQCLYAGLLADPRSGVRDVLLKGVNGYQALLGRLSWPVMRRAMAAGMNARAQLLPELIARVGVELDWFDAVLAVRGRYLVGQKFGRADLTVASLLAPIALPAVEPVSSLYAGITWPKLLADALTSWQQRETVIWVRATYAAHR